MNQTLDKILDKRVEHMIDLQKRYGNDGSKLYIQILDDLPSLKGDIGHPNYERMMLNKCKIAYAQSIIKLDKDK